VESSDINSMVSMKVNGLSIEVVAPPEAPLLRVLGDHHARCDMRLGRGFPLRGDGSEHACEVAKALGLWGGSVSKAVEFQGAVTEWLARPGTALLSDNVEPIKTVAVMPRTAMENVYWLAVSSLKPVTQGQAGDIFQIIRANI
jgi:hypothetical protein